MVSGSFPLRNELFGRKEPLSAATLSYTHLSSLSTAWTSAHIKSADFILIDAAVYVTALKHHTKPWAPSK